MDLECQVLQFFSLSFTIVLVSFFFLYRETNPEKMEKLEKKDGYGITII